jgi:hypothetical protein
LIFAGLSSQSRKEPGHYLLPALLLRSRPDAMPVSLRMEFTLLFKPITPIIPSLKYYNERDRHCLEFASSGFTARRSSDYVLPVLTF